MKIKPNNLNNLTTYRNTRFNENTVGIANSIKSGNKKEEKVEYASLVLMSMMEEKNYLKNALLKESFEKAKRFTDNYEGETS